MRDLGLGDERDLCGSVSVSASACSRSELLYLGSIAFALAKS
jgi:hypothetical protein